MEQAAGNARIEMQAALRKSRMARLHRRIGWCDRQLFELKTSTTPLTEAQARRGLEIFAQREHMRGHLARQTSTFTAEVAT